MSVQQRLEAWLERHGAVAGSVHRRDGALLHLVAHVRLPPPVVEVSRTIPHGKGMAGLAWSRGVPVQTCDLQTDATGDVRPGARAVQAGAAVAIPVGDPVTGVVGAAFPFEGDLPGDLLAALTAEAPTVLG